MSAVHAKVKAGGIAGAAATILVVVLGACGVDVSPDVAAAIATVFGFLAGFAKKA